MVASSLLGRRLRAADGSTTWLSGQANPATSAARLSVIGAQRAGVDTTVTSAGRDALVGLLATATAGVYSDVAIQPEQWASIQLDSTAWPTWGNQRAWWVSTPAAAVSLAGVAWTGRLDQAPPFIADVCLADDITVGCGHTDGDLVLGDPIALTAPSSAVAGALVPDQRAATSTAWAASSATYGRAAVAVPADAPTEAAGITSAHQITGTSGAALAAGAYLRPVAVAPACWQWATGRQVSVGGWVMPTGGALTGHYTIEVTSAAGAVTTLAGPTFTVAAGAATRVVSTLAVPGALDVRGVRVALVVDAGTTATSCAWWCPQVYSGGDRGGVAGLDVTGHPTGGLVLAIDAATGTRTSSRVDLYPEWDVGAVTAASVTVDGVLVGWGEGTVGVSPTWTPVAGTTIAVRIEEVRCGDGAAWSVCAVDGGYTLDVSDRLVSADVTTATEATPTDGSLPYGNYTAGSCALVLENSDNLLAPAVNALIDTSHRIELVVGVSYAAPAAEQVYAGSTVEVVEAIPAGVFWSTSWDAPSDSAQANVAGVDLLGQYGQVAVSVTPIGPVDGTSPDAWIGLETSAIIRQVALSTLRLPSWLTDVQIRDYLLKWSYGTSTAASYLADLAKATASTLWADGLGRLAVRRTDVVDANAVVALTDERAFISAKYPLSPDRIRNDITVTGAPLVSIGAPSSGNTSGWVVGPGAGAGALALGSAWSPRTGDVLVPAGTSVRTIVAFDAAHDPALTSSSVTITAVYAAALDPASVQCALASDAGTTALVDRTGALSVTTSVSATFAVVIATNTSSVDAYLLNAKLVGYPLAPSTTLVAAASSAASITRYGDRPLATVVRLAQTAEQLSDVASTLLDAYQGVGSDGVRRLPDVAVTTLALPWVDPLSRVNLSSDSSGIAGSWATIAHHLSWGITPSSQLTLRRPGTGVLFLVADIDISDDVRVLA